MSKHKVIVMVQFAKRWSSVVSFGRTNRIELFCSLSTLKCHVGVFCVQYSYAVSIYLLKT